MAKTSSSIALNGDRPSELTPKAVPLPKFILPLGRGARGKSTFARWAIERAIDAGRSPVCADGDRTNPSLGRYFDGVLSPPSADDADVEAWLAAIVEEQLIKRFDVVVDLGGGDLVLKRIAREMHLVAWLASQGIQCVAIHLIGPSADDLAYLHDVEKGAVFAPDATALVFNEALTPKGRSPQAAFAETVEEHSILAETLGRGARLVWMPRLEPALDLEKNRLLFIQAIEGKAREGVAALGPWKAQQVAIWRRRMEEACAPIAEWLP
jgi:hypothetical protein